MFDIGFLELLILSVVGLLVLGPERLPKAARTVGLWVGQIKRTLSGMQREISSQLKTEELRQTLKEHQQTLDDNLQQANREVESLAEPVPASSSRSAAYGTESPIPAPQSRTPDATADHTFSRHNKEKGGP